MGIDCLLISTNRVTTPYPVYPLGTAYLADALESAGHGVVHYDLLAEGGFSGLSELLNSRAFALAAVSVRNIDTVDSNTPALLLEDSIRVTTLLKSSAELPVVIGGPAFSIMPDVIMELTGCDYGIIGEGEKLIVSIANAIETGDLPAERIMRGRPVDGFMDRRRFNRKCTDFYLKHGGMLNIQTKRGCPYRCLYCSYPAIEGNIIRYREPEAVADEFARLVKDYGARYIFFTDSVFNDSSGHYIEVAEALIRSGNRTPWCAFFRPANIEEDLLDLLVQSGLSAMEIGTDGASDTTLDALNKGFTFDDVLSMNSKAVGKGIPCAHYIVFGGPDETEVTVKEGLANTRYLNDAVAFAFLGIRILPGTGLHTRAVDEGVVSSEDNLLEPVFYFSSHVAKKFMDRAIRDAWHGIMERIYPCAEAEARIGRLHAMGHAGPMWDALVRHRLRRRRKV